MLGASRDRDRTRSLWLGLGLLASIGPACTRPGATSTGAGASDASTTRELVATAGRQVAAECRRSPDPGTRCGLDLPAELCASYPHAHPELVACIHDACTDRFGWMHATAVRTYAKRRDACLKAGAPDRCAPQRILRPEAAGCILDALAFPRRSSPDLQLTPGEAWWCSRLPRTTLQSGGSVERVCVDASGAGIVTTPVVATRVDTLP